jgi:hypothetical protein
MYLQSYCQAFGYKLAEPESQDVLDFIKAQLAKIPGSKSIANTN